VNEITITIPASGAIQRHVEGLQTSLTKRNEEIARLAERLAEAEAGEPNQKALNAAYRRGWQAAAHELMSATGVAAQALSKVRKDAWDIYLKGERHEF
jgi:predicted component of type VI protein secretion system